MEEEHCSLSMKTLPFFKCTTISTTLCVSISSELLCYLEVVEVVKIMMSNEKKFDLGYDITVIVPIEYILAELDLVVLLHFKKL